MKKNTIVEVHEFNPIQGISDEALLKAVRKAQYSFFRKQKGFIECRILKTKATWLKITYWDDISNAELANQEFLHHSSCLPFVQMISPLSERRLFMSQQFSTKASNQ